MTEDLGEPAGSSAGSADAGGADAPLPVPRVSELGHELTKVLESAARLQQVVPDAVLVGGTVSALYAAHRVSFDHDHVLQLKDRYLSVLEAVEASDGWATSVRASRPPMTILGRLDGIEAGPRQMRRTVPLEVELLDLGNGKTVRIPTRDEALRVKAYLVVQRNAVRDYLDVAAMADRMGITRAAGVLSHLDDYYTDRSDDDESVVSALVMKLARPDPRDKAAIAELARYRKLDTRWHDWKSVRHVCAQITQAMLDLSGPP